MNTEIKRWLKGSETIEALAAKEMELDGRARIKAADLARAECAAGEAFLDGDGTAGAEVNVVLRLRLEVEAVQRAIATVRGKRSDAIAARFADRAKDARALASKKTSELDGLTKKISRLCEQLSELEGVEGGTFLPNAGQQKTVALSGAIAALERQAGDLEAAAVRNNGLFDSVDTVVLVNDAIVAAVLSDESTGPSCAEVRAWLAAVETEAEARHKRPANFEHLPRRVRIEWKDGRITGASYVFTPELAPPNPTTIGNQGDAGIDVQGGTFRGVAA